MFSFSINCRVTLEGMKIIALLLTCIAIFSCGATDLNGQATEQQGDSFSVRNPTGRAVKTGVASANKASSPKRITAIDSTTSTLVDKEIIELVGYYSETDGYRASAQYLAGSSLPVDGLMVFPAKGGRVVLLDRSKTVELKWLHLLEDEDITLILKDLAANAVDRLLIDFGSKTKRLRCDFLKIDVRQLVLTGMCELKQSDKATQPTMIEVLNPDQVHLGESLVFSGSDSPSIIYTDANEALIKIVSNNRVRDGGTITSLASFRNTVSIGLGVFSATPVTQYGKINIGGDYYASGLSSNCSTRRLSIDASIQDPRGEADTGTTRNKARKISFGRVTETFSIKVLMRYGWGGVFGFVFPGAVGNLEISSYQFGYDHLGAALPHNGSSYQIFKTDTQQNSAVIDASLVMHADAGRTARFSLEASPGPTNNSSLKAVGDSVAAELGILQNDGIENYECFGNKLLAGSDCASVRAGFASSISNSSVKTFFTNFYELRSPALVSQGTVLDEVTVRDRVYLHLGSSTYFRNCRLPATWNFKGSTQVTPTIISLRNCNLRSTKIAPPSFDNFLLGLEGQVAGLDISNIPVETIPYWYLDGVAHPKLEGISKTFPNDTMTKISNPAFGSDAILKVYTGSTKTPFVPATGRIVGIDRERVTGAVVFPNSNTTSTLGCLAADLGVAEGRSELDLEFIEGGALEAGISGRFSSEFAMIWARLNVETNELMLTIGYEEDRPAVTVNLPKSKYGKALSYDTIYDLGLEIDDTEVRVFLDGVQLITRATTYQSDKTKWGYKCIRGNGKASVGPLVHKWCVRPIKNSSSANAAKIQNERRTIQ